MAWNQPGGSQRPDDPWKKQHKPSQPDWKGAFEPLITWLKQFKLQSKLMRSPHKKISGQGKAYLSYLAPIFILGALALSGFTWLGPNQEAVVLQWGQYHSTLTAGLHWLVPFVQKSYVLPIEQRNHEVFSGSVMTLDNNLVNFSLNVQYEISNPQAYLFHTADQKTLLSNALANSLHQVLGQQNLSVILSADKETENTALLAVIQPYLSNLDVGFNITDISFKTLELPNEVSQVAEERAKATQEAKALMTTASTTGQQLIAEAESVANQAITKAKAYQQGVVLRAQGATARYLALLPEYEANPMMAKERLYVQTMTTVLAKVSKIWLDLPSGSTVHLSLPLASSGPGVKPEASIVNPSTGTDTGLKEKSPIQVMAGYGSDTTNANNEGY